MSGGPNQDSHLERALERWSRLLGAAYVTRVGPEIAAAEVATFAIGRRIPAILRPADREQIQACLRVANECRVPLYPISSGKNWGYGSRVPPHDGCALVDLSRLNRILDFSEELAYITVEPGVTQAQLFTFLRERGSRLWIDATGSSPDCSLIGNVMERGFGHTPYGDHSAHVCGLEVVLPTGDVIHTGPAAFANAQTAPVNRSGIGPALDGLFSQSNLGIVTRMTVWLMPQPECFEAFFYRCEHAAGLPALIDRLRDLRLRDILRSSIHIGNDYKVLNGIRQYPWEATDGRTPLSPELMGRFRKELTFGHWNASGGLYGTRAQVAEAKRLLARAVDPERGKLRFLSEKKLRLARRFAKPASLLMRWDISRTIDIVEPVVGLMRGIPTRQALGSAYWRKRIPIPADPDPDRDHCGLLWFAPVAPAQGKQVQALTDLASEMLLASGFEPMISLTLLTPRAVYAVISITYDRDVPGEDERALACYAELSGTCLAAGYVPYRLGIQWMQEVCALSDSAALVSSLKQLLDPNRILAPGRYEALAEDQPHAVSDAHLNSVRA